LNLFTSLIQNTTWSQDLIQRELDIMQDEYAAYSTEYPLILSDALEDRLIDGPLSRNLFSCEIKLKDVSPEVFAERSATHWQNAPVTIYLSGKIDETVITDLEETVGTLPYSPKSRSIPGSSWKSLNGEKVIVDTLDAGVGQTYLSWVIPLAASLPSDMDLLLGYLLGGMSSSRVARLNRQAGYGYELSARSVTYTDLSYLYLQTIAPTAKAEAVRSVTESALDSFLQTPLTEEEFGAAKTMLAADMERNMGDAIEMAEAYAHDGLLKEAVSSPEERIRSVREFDFKNVRSAIHLISQASRAIGILPV
jgi:predicted Zn-dependent peptidase